VRSEAGEWLFYICPEQVSVPAMGQTRKRPAGDGALGIESLFLL